MKTTSFKIGIILIAVIAGVAYVLDDLFYYSEMRMAEIFVFPVAILLILAIVLGLIIPSVQKSR